MSIRRGSNLRRAAAISLLSAAYCAAVGCGALLGEGDKTADNRTPETTAQPSSGTNTGSPEPAVRSRAENIALALAEALSGDLIAAGASPEEASAVSSLAHKRALEVAGSSLHGFSLEDGEGAILSRVSAGFMEGSMEGLAQVAPERRMELMDSAVSSVTATAGAQSQGMPREALLDVIDRLPAAALSSMTRAGIPEDRLAEAAERVARKALERAVAMVDPNDIEIVVVVVVKSSARTVAERPELPSAAADGLAKGASDAVMGAVAAGRGRADDLLGSVAEGVGAGANEAAARASSAGVLVDDERLAGLARAAAGAPVRALLESSALTDDEKEAAVSRVTEKAVASASASADATRAEAMAREAGAGAAREALKRAAPEQQQRMLGAVSAGGSAAIARAPIDAETKKQRISAQSARLTQTITENADAAAVEALIEEHTKKASEGALRAAQDTSPDDADELLGGISAGVVSGASNTSEDVFERVVKTASAGPAEALLALNYGRDVAQREAMMAAIAENVSTRIAEKVLTAAAAGDAAARAQQMQRAERLVAAATEAVAQKAVERASAAERAQLYSAATASVTSALARAVTDEAERRELILASSAKAIAVSTQATSLDAAARAELVAAYSAESNERLMKELAAREGSADPAELDLSLLDELSAGIDATVQETASASEREALLTAATEGAAAGTSAAAAEYEKIAELTPLQAYMLRLQSEEPAIRRHVMGIAGDLTAEHAASGNERARVRLEQALAAETDSLSSQERVLVAHRLIQRSLEGAINEQTHSRRGILAYARGVADGLKRAIAARLARLPTGAQAELNGNIDRLLGHLSSFVSTAQGSTTQSEGTSVSSPGGDETDASVNETGDSSDSTSGSTASSPTESSPNAGGDEAGSSSGSVTSPALTGVPAAAAQDPRTCAADSNRVLLMVTSGLYACAERTAVQASFPAQLEAYLALRGSNQCSQSTASSVSFATLQAETDSQGLYRPFSARCSP